jgi:hypothetical protein
LSIPEDNENYLDLYSSFPSSLMAAMICWRAKPVLHPRRFLFHLQIPLKPQSTIHSAHIPELTSLRGTGLGPWCWCFPSNIPVLPYYTLTSGHMIEV